MTPSNDKENPNPVIHSIQKRTHLSNSFGNPLLGSDTLRRYSLGLKLPPKSEIESCYDIESTPTKLESAPTIEERLIAIALSEAAYPNASLSNEISVSSLSGGDLSPSLELLHNSGFPLLDPHQLRTALKIPSFIPSEMRKSPSSSCRKIRRDAFTAGEVFNIIRNIQDPEHPLTLEQLNVVRLELITVVDIHPDLDCINETASSSENRIKKSRFSTVIVQFTPTIPHCSMATLIGLTIRVKLLRSLPSRFKVVVEIEPGTHASEHAVNKQLADKERVRAALENEHLLGVVNRCIAGTSSA
ncbi:hypothetical protein ACHAW6_007184 [Cyclotella cf. meneghiniana]